MEQRDFFISYTNADEAWAVWIANVLKSNGYTVYVQAFDIKPGDNFLEKMNEFLKNSRNFIAVWSEAYPKSRFCMAELQSAFYAWNKKTMDCLLPVRIDNHSLEPLYAGLVYVDLPDMGAVSETKLINAVRETIPPHVVTPETPPQEDTTRLAMYLFQRGMHYEGKRDYTKAQEYYEQLVEKDDANAKALGFWSLGRLYEYSIDDDAKALEYYQKAADNGNDYATSKAKELREKLNGE